MGVQSGCDFLDMMERGVPSGKAHPVQCGCIFVCFLYVFFWDKRININLHDMHNKLNHCGNSVHRFFYKSQNHNKIYGYITSPQIDPFKFKNLNLQFET